MMATGDGNASYDRHLMGISIIPLVAFVVLFVVNLFFHLDSYRPASLAILACAGMAFGMMIAVFMNARTQISLSRRWTVLFALTFACSLSIIYTFLTVFWMSSTGDPLYNGDFNNTLANDAANIMLMLPMAVTAVATLAYGVIFNEYLKLVKPELSHFSPGGRM
jgi:hypothetical protein